LRILAASSFCLALSVASLARAQGNDHSSALGGRSALMGNTGVALGRDGAAPFSNPATIVRIDDRNIAFSVNLLSLHVDSFGDWRQPASVDPRFGSVELNRKTISSTRLSAVPSTLCLFVFFSELTGHDSPTPQEDPTPWSGGRQKLAVCLATLESENLIAPAYAARASTTAGVTAQALSLVRTWNRAQVGPSYSAQINDQLSLGASVHGAFTTTSFVQDAAGLTTATDGTVTQSALDFSGNGDSLDLTAIVGGTYRLGGVTLGASVQVPSLHVLGRYRTALTQMSAATADSAATFASGSGSFRAGPPVRFALGAGLTLDRLTLEADGAVTLGARHGIATSLHVDTTTLANDTLTPATFQEFDAIRTQTTLNGAVGMEYFVRPRLSVLGGLWTDLSELAPLNPRSAPELGNLVQSRQDHVGLSLGLGSYGTDGELLVGAQLGYGWGKALVANLYSLPVDWSVVSSQSYSALFVIAGATNFRSIKRAIERVKNAVMPGGAGETKGDAPKADAPAR
jgi:hypothetical protein